MRKEPRSIELLSPAKDLICGREAINHGADAVYIGAPKFGARAAAGNTLDDIDRMTRNELRVALRESRETAEAKDKVISDKNKKVDELAEKLAKKQTKEPKSQDVASELTMTLSSMTVNVRSGISRFSELFEQLSAHGEAHGFDHRPQMVAALNQLILDCEILRERFALPEQAPDDSVPEWLKGEGE